MDTNGNSVASPADSDTMATGDVSPRNQPTDNQSDSQQLSENHPDTVMSSIEEEKGQKTDKETSNS